MSKLNRPIPSSAVGAGIACPKRQSQLFSAERTSSPRIKRQHYPRFDTASCATLAAPGKGIKTDKGNLMIGVGDLHTPHTNDPFTIAKCSDLVCINTCIQVDLMGQVVSGSYGLRNISGSGGCLLYTSCGCLTSNVKFILQKLQK